MPLLELRNVVKKYRVGREVITALNGVDLAVEAGEFIAILGTCLLYTSPRPRD